MAELAEQAEVLPISVQKIETGGARVVRFTELRAIANALDVPWSQIRGADQPLLAETDADLAEIVGGRPVQCAGASGDAAAVLAHWLGQEPESPAFRQSVTELHAALTAEPGTV
jgi:transcriptional regulator with XRE-family HTH domain